MVKSIVITKCSLAYCFDVHWGTGFCLIISLLGSHRMRVVVKITQNFGLQKERKEKEKKKIGEHCLKILSLRVF